MSDTDIRKKTYTYADLEGLARKLKFEYEKKLADQRDRILDLRDEVKSLETELDGFKSRSRHINKALLAAVSKAEELESAARQKYDMELKSLRLFHAKWLGYYKKIIAQYPIDDELLKAARFNDKMNKIFESESAQYLNDESAEELKNARSNYEAAAAQAVAERELSGVKTPERSSLERSDEEVEKEALQAIRAAAQALKGAEVKESVKAERPMTPEEVYESERARLLKNNQQAALEDKPAAVNTAVNKGKPANIFADSNDEDAPAPVHGMRRYYGDKNPDIMREYMRSGTNGFSLEEALNPKESLADLIKDVLGDDN